MAGDNARAQLALGVRLHREHGYRGALVVVDGGGVVHRVDDGAVGCHDVEVGHCDGALVVEVEVALAVLAGNAHDGACAQVVGGSGGAPVDNDDAKTRVGTVGVGGADGDRAGLDRRERAVGSGRDDGGVRTVPDEAARLHGNFGSGEVVGIARRAEPQGALHGGLKAGLNDVTALHLEFLGQRDVSDVGGGDIDRVGRLARGNLRLRLGGAVKGELDCPGDVAVRIAHACAADVRGVHEPAGLRCVVIAADERGEDRLGVGFVGCGTPNEQFGGDAFVCGVEGRPIGADVRACQHAFGGALPGGSLEVGVLCDCGRPNLGAHVVEGGVERLHGGGVIGEGHINWQGVLCNEALQRLVCLNRVPREALYRKGLGHSLHRGGRGSPGGLRSLLGGLRVLIGGGLRALFGVLRLICKGGCGKACWNGKRCQQGKGAQSLRARMGRADVVAAHSCSFIRRLADKVPAWGGSIESHAILPVRTEVGLMGGHTAQLYQRVWELLSGVSWQGAKNVENCARFSLHARGQYCYSLSRPASAIQLRSADINLQGTQDCVPYGYPPSLGKPKCTRRVPTSMRWANLQLCGGWTLP